MKQKLIHAFWFSLIVGTSGVVTTVLLVLLYGPLAGEEFWETLVPILEAFAWMAVIIVCLCIMNLIESYREEKRNEH